MAERSLFWLALLASVLQNTFCCGGFESSYVLNEFDIKFKDQISKRNTKDNFIYSAYGILSVIESMVEMLEPSNQESVRKILGVSNEQHMCPPIPKEKDPEFAEATKIWVDKSAQLADEKFLSKKRTEIKSLAIMKNADAATKTINSWVANHTMGMIKSLLKPGVISQNTNLVVTNALAFHGKWKYPFESKYTEPRDFKTADNEKIKVPTMVTTMKTRHYRDPERAEIAELPYAGDRYSMFIILPSADGGKSLSKEEVEDIIKNKMKRHVKLEVFLPKFKLNSEYELHEMLVKLGLQSLFTHVDVIKKPRGVSFNDVIHKVSLEVNEKGTKASAGSAGVTSRSFPLRFRANEPFEFFIRDMGHEKNIFHGRVLKPEYE